MNKNNWLNQQSQTVYPRFRSLAALHRYEEELEDRRALVVSLDENIEALRLLAADFSPQGDGRFAAQVMTVKTLRERIIEWDAKHP